jgi:glycosyltransferase involved in cell wall biosynthesis
MLPPADTETPPMPKRMLVVFSPYPPAKNGIADYVAELLPHHLDEFDITLVIDDDAPVPEVSELRVLLASEFRKHRGSFLSALKIYHIGNNPHHCYMLDFLGSDPGVVVLHDYNLCYLHEMATLRWGNEARHYVAMEREYGVLGREILAGQMRNGHRELFTGYELALNGYVLERATAIVTHSRQVQYKVAARAPHKPVWYIPHHLSPRAGDFFSLTKQEARSQLGLAQDEIVVTAVGFVKRAKQIPMTLAALSSLRGQVDNFRFVLAGERQPLEYDVDADIARSGLSDRVTCTDYLDEETFFRHLAATDIVVNLRYPSGGEMSGTLVRALGLGVPTIVLDHGPMGELPDTVVRKIAWGEGSKVALTEALRGLMTNDLERSELGARAAAYVRRNHNIIGIVRQYGRILHESALTATAEIAPLTLNFPHPVAIARKLRQFGESRHTMVESAGGQIWWSVPGVPLGINQEHIALVVAAEDRGTAALLSQVFGWKPEAVVTMKPEEFLGERVHGSDGCPLPAALFTFALAIVPAEMPEAFAELLMRRLNAAVRRDGSICVETWTPDSSDGDSNAPLGQKHLPQRLQDAGFGSVQRWSQQDGLIGALIADPSGEIETRQFACATARKISDYAVWRFVESAKGLPMRLGGRVGARPGA